MNARPRKTGWRLTLGATAIATFLGCYTGPHVDPGYDASSATPAAAVVTVEAGASGLPCEIEAFLGAHCTSCHSDPPSQGPMALVTAAQLEAPSRSDPSRSVAQLALARMRDTKNPMPPSGALAEADVAAFASWVGSGAHATGCAPDDTPARSLDGGGGPECVLASDCAGSLICRNGLCDVECVQDKDCAPTFSCKHTRCEPARVGGGSTTDPVDGGTNDAGATASDYHDFTAVDSWSSVDIRGLSSGAYDGSAFDGRYVYFAPDGNNGKVLRFDAQGPFTTDASWAVFDVTTLDTRAIAYRGSVFDGRYLYLIPSGAFGIVTRYDTQSPFANAASWTTFEVPTVDASAKGFTGATFDGRFVYLVPAFGTMAARLDTHGGFTLASSWTAFDIKTAAAGASSFAGAVYDGHYVYFVPWRAATTGSGILMRYDPNGAFADPASWSSLDLTTLNPAASGYHTAAFDGRYLYLVPGWTAPTPAWSTSVLARFDTRAPFAAAESWSFFDMTALTPTAAGFNAAAFDGRYLVLSPGYSGGVYRSSAFRLDTTASLSNAASWSELDLTSVRSSLSNVKGAAFDGRYVYFTPVGGSAARFDARATPSMPALPAFFGSFF